MTTSREKLKRAAVELITSQGYQHTTVQQIADRAGVTERTFFRQFADKSEVFFGRTDEYVTTHQQGLTQSTATTVMGKAIDAYSFIAQTMFQDLHAGAKKRNEIIQSEPDLQERELLKDEFVTNQLAQTLAQEFEPVAATLAAKSAGVIFQVAFKQWLNSDGTQSLATVFAIIVTAWKQLR
ncbi:TetR family transcriptional regulator [Periweissella cryptocerci]|uniref:TetR family transcriptional regulator n=1 Tax=Periweissella cryptocerci TaxID=2506420 RepID=A0A4P6YU75_9LACO|nr:TetR/AcrR family transcriptional regulator [Periweissella cryptocerci]QBO36227.1 TetR family transcriptional regulator [Periweissella cryptocerci]